MYARFTEATIDPKKREQTLVIAESIFTAARQQKGFKGVSFCLDPKGEAVFVSLWESKEALLANEASGYYQEQVAKLKDVLTKPSTRLSPPVASRSAERPRPARGTTPPTKRREISRRHWGLGEAASKDFRHISTWRAAAFDCRLRRHGRYQPARDFARLIAGRWWRVTRHPDRDRPARPGSRRQLRKRTAVGSTWAVDDADRENLAQHGVLDPGRI